MFLLFIKSISYNYEKVKILCALWIYKLKKKKKKWIYKCLMTYLRQLHGPKLFKQLKKYAV